MMHVLCVISSLLRNTPCHILDPNFGILWIQMYVQSIVTRASGNPSRSTCLANIKITNSLRIYRLVVVYLHLHCLRMFASINTFSIWLCLGNHRQLVTFSALLAPRKKNIANIHASWTAAEKASFSGRKLTGACSCLFILDIHIVMYLYFYNKFLSYLILS